MTNVQIPMSNSQCPIPNAQWPTPDVGLSPQDGELETGNRQLAVQASDQRRLLRRSREQRVETDAAAGLVDALRPQQHAVAARHEALRVIRGIAADHADCMRLGDVL